MPSVSRNVASSWLRSKLQAVSRLARAKGIFDVHSDGDEDEEVSQAKPVPQKSKSPKKPAREKGIFDQHSEEDDEEGEAAPQVSSPKPVPQKSKSPQKPVREKGIFDQHSEEEDPPAGPGGAEGPEGRWQQFLNEKYEGGGTAMVPNPKQNVSGNHPKVQFATAMRDVGFAEKVRREFSQWNREQGQPKKAPKPESEEGFAEWKEWEPESSDVDALQVGQVLENADQIRVGDVIQSGRSDSPLRRIVQLPDEHGLLLQQLDAHGNNVGDPRHYSLKNILQQGRHRKVNAPAKAQKPKEPSHKWEDLLDEKEEPKHAPDEERVPIGGFITNAKHLRVGDVIKSSRPDSPLRKIVALGPGIIEWQEYTADGELTGNPWVVSAPIVEQTRYQRVEDPNTPERQQARKEKAKQQEALRKKLQKERAERQGQLPQWAQAHEAILDIARHGEVMADVALDKKGANISRKRTLRLGGKKEDFVWKPKSGEVPHLREGITPGTYHTREAAAYNVDVLLGEGTVVPPTMTNGTGSYQRFAKGSKSFHKIIESGGMGMGARWMSGELRDHPDFQRTLVLDLLIGHEDRHGGNIMMRVDPKAPQGVQFFAIDNGLALAEPGKAEDRYIVQSPWSSLFKGGDRAFAEVTQDIPPAIHAKLKEVDPEEFLTAQITSGVTEPKALLAALVRLTVMQRDPTIVGKLGFFHSRLFGQSAVRSFLYYSGTYPQKLLDLVEDGPSLKTLEKLVEDTLGG